VDDEFRQQLLERLKAIEQRLDAFGVSQNQLKDATRDRARIQTRRVVGNPIDRRQLPFPLTARTFMQCVIVLDVPDHCGRSIPLGPGQKHGLTGNAWNAFGLNIRHEIRDGDHKFMHSSHHGRRFAMPDPHHAVERDSQDKRHISALA
jgi:hypothetical protein